MSPARPEARRLTKECQCASVETIESDILILGAGGAGLCAALHAADRAPGLSVAVVVKGLLGRAGCPRMVQG
ncbi:MAG: FAD-binding protein, partial [Candidatus Rokubacteria bacterium]|nr:FAD-binding protein [Candidatus Rokubacteria bacterium]